MPEVDRFRLWGTTFVALNLEQTVNEIERLLLAGVPSYFVTANVHTMMILEQDPYLRAAVDEAAFVVADGMPLVWAAKLRGRRKLERVAGSDLLPALCNLAARKGYRVFLLGGEPGVATAATIKLAALYPGLHVVGSEAPPFRPLTPTEEDELADRIRATRPDFVFVQSSQPKGEVWIHQNYRRIGVPVCGQFGGSLNFVIGKVNRAPQWVQRIGMEWGYRIWCEPRRLVGRYTRNAIFLTRKLMIDVGNIITRRTLG